MNHFLLFKAYNLIITNRITHQKKRKRNKPVSEISFSSICMHTYTHVIQIKRAVTKQSYNCGFRELVQKQMRLCQNQLTQFNINNLLSCSFSEHLFIKKTSESAILTDTVWKLRFGKLQSSWPSENQLQLLGYWQKIEHYRFFMFSHKPNDNLKMFYYADKLKKSSNIIQAIYLFHSK